MSALAELKNRGVADVFFVGLRRAERAASLGRGSVAASHAADLHHPPDPQNLPVPLEELLGQIAADLKPIYGAPSSEAVWAALEEFEEKWGTRYPAISQLWRNA
jgi:hypothetical protein